MSAETTTNNLIDRIEKLADAATDASLRDALERLRAAAQKPSREVRRADLRRALSSSACVPVVIALAHSAGWVKPVAKICGKAGVAGAVGGAGGLRAANLYYQGAIDGDVAVKHVGSEAGCGFVTSSSGTAGTLAVFMLTGSMGPMALAAGMGASMGSRYLYKQAVGDVLPDEQELEQRIRQSTDAADTTDAAPQDVGPGSEPNDHQTSPVEDIGPNRDATSGHGGDFEATDGAMNGDPGGRSDDDVVSEDSNDPEDDTPFEGIGPAE